MVRLVVNYNHKNLTKTESTCWWIRSFKYFKYLWIYQQVFAIIIVQLNIILHVYHYVEEFLQDFCVCSTDWKYYMLMVYQYKRKTRRPILSAVSELLSNKMQDYTALFGVDAFYCNECNHFLSVRRRKFLHHYHTQCICMCTWFQNHWLFI